MFQLGNFPVELNDIIDVSIKTQRYSKQFSIYKLETRVQILEDERWQFYEFFQTFGSICKSTGTKRIHHKYIFYFLRKISCRGSRNSTSMWRMRWSPFFLVSIEFYNNNKHPTHVLIGQASLFITVRRHS